MREEGVSSRHLRRLNSAVTKRFTLLCALTFYNEKKVIKSNRAVGVFFSSSFLFVLIFAANEAVVTVATDILIITVLVYQ